MFHLQPQLSDSDDNILMKLCTQSPVAVNQDEPLKHSHFPVVHNKCIEAPMKTDFLSLNVLK